MSEEENSTEEKDWIALMMCFKAIQKGSPRSRQFSRAQPSLGEVAGERGRAALKPPRLLAARSRHSSLRGGLRRSSLSPEKRIPLPRRRLVPRPRDLELREVQGDKAVPRAELGTRQAAGHELWPVPLPKPRESPTRAGCPGAGGEAAEPGPSRGGACSRSPPRPKARLCAWGEGLPPPPPLPPARVGRAESRGAEPEKERKASDLGPGRRSAGWRGGGGAGAEAVEGERQPGPLGRVRLRRGRGSGSGGGGGRSWRQQPPRQGEQQQRRRRQSAAAVREGGGAAETKSGASFGGGARPPPPPPSLSGLECAGRASGDPSPALVSLGGGAAAVLSASSCRPHGRLSALRLRSPGRGRPLLPPITHRPSGDFVLLLYHITQIFWISIICVKLSTKGEN
ncbi:uncharacterized protein LOC116422540 [Sarcophilus harrisii]|uniref:uncharacterized protein LOC116422540 n=1 Tax=Sarcophilus harrisii TaxID=9305 RepID=UPI001301D2EE|nr:uncharacterized protein LOC116422540 [Sarcophilus harrisii]